VVEVEQREIVEKVTFDIIYPAPEEKIISRRKYAKYIILKQFEIKKCIIQ